jgi:hypothetical protein
MSQGLILIEALCSSSLEKNKKKEKSKEGKKKQPGAFFPGLEPDTPCWLCQVGFSGLLGAKG